VTAESETDLKMKRLFRPRQITIELLSTVKGMNVILYGLCPAPINRSRTVHADLAFAFCVTLVLSSPSS
jgi:hypothetical protein